MLRPATPLAAIFFFATAFLLLSSLTTPVISRLSLGTYDGSRFGVWGYCSGPQTGSRCSPIEVGYKLDELRPTRDQFRVSEDTRQNISYILIIHPIAALFSFVCFCMATATHFHAPGHSPRFLMGLFILTLPTFLIALLAFLVDILLFIPHVSVGGWFVLVSVVLLLLASIVTCGMRRTLISRKARRKRIAENPQMSGEDYYLRQAAKNAGYRVDSPPARSGASESPYKEKTADFGSYDSSNGTVLLDGQRANQPESMRQNNYDTPPSRNNYSAPRNQIYDRPPPLQVARNEPEPYRNAAQNDYYNQDQPVRQEATAYNGGSQYRIRGGLTSPTQAYSQQRGGRMGAPPQYAYDTPQRGMRQNDYNGNSGRGRRGYDAGPPRQAMNQQPQGYQQGQVNPYQANVSGLAYRTTPSPPRMNGYPPVRQQQPGLYDRANHAFSTDEESADRQPQVAAPMPAQIAEAPQLAINSSSDNLITGARDENFPKGPTPLPSSAADSIEQQPLPRPIRSNSSPGLPTFLDHPDVPVIPDAFWSAPYPMDKQDFQNRNNELSSQQTQILPPRPSFGPELRKVNSVDSMPLSTRQRSPARSDYSHYTSVSQRGINPHWRPPPVRLPYSHAPSFAGPSREQVLLDSNPDFSLPVNRSRFGIGARGGMRGGPMARVRGGSGRGGGMMHPNLAATSAPQPYPQPGAIRRVASLPRGMSGDTSLSFGSPYGLSRSQSQTQPFEQDRRLLRTAVSLGGPIRDGRYPAPPTVF